MRLTDAQKLELHRRSVDQALTAAERNAALREQYADDLAGLADLNYLIETARDDTEDLGGGHPSLGSIATAIASQQRYLDALHKILASAISCDTDAGPFQEPESAPGDPGPRPAVLR